MTNAHSVKARLKNSAMENNRTLQSELTSYGLERTIHRISISDYVNDFTLKGGIFLYALFDTNYSRSTVDIDLLSKTLSNQVEKVRAIFEEIFLIKVDDALVYDIDTMKVNTIAEFKEVPGVNISIMAYLDKTRIPVQIDIGFDDIVYPERQIIEFPTLLNNCRPEVYAYPITSVIAEKFEAMVKNGYANSRYKDFYDVYILINEYDFDGIELKESIMTTFRNRKTGFHDIAIFNEDFLEDKYSITRWNAFIKKKKAMQQLSYFESIRSINNFLKPIVISIVEDTQFSKTWNCKMNKWI